MTIFRCLLLSLLLCALVTGRCLADYETGLKAWEHEKFDVAFEQFTHSADKGDSRAQNHLGMMYEDGQGLGRSDKDALNWYRQAAEQGYAPAEFNLGRMYFNGKGTRKDDAQAVFWYRRAALQGLSIAQFFLGLMYDLGKGVEASPSQAYTWFSLAADQGDKEAEFKRDRVASRLTEVEQNTATQAVTEYTLKINPSKASAAHPVPTLKALEAISKLAKADAAISPEKSTAEERLSTESSQPGVNEVAIYQTQVYLNKLGFDVGQPNGVAEERFQQAIKAFQSAMGEVPDGKISIKLMTALERERATKLSAQRKQQILRTIAVLDEKTRIFATQRELARLGLKPGSADGAVGGKTRRAIHTYQRTHNLEVNSKPTTTLLYKLLEDRLGVHIEEAQGTVTSSAINVKEDIPNSSSSQSTSSALAQPANKPPQASPPSKSLSKPKGDPTVYSVQSLLDRLGYNVGTVDGVIGYQTVKAVKAFQRDIGKRPSGNIGTGVEQSLKEAEQDGKFSRKIVRDIQRALSQLGYSPGSADGIVGRATQEAIRRFQRNKGIEVDGQLSVTLAKHLKVR